MILLPALLASLLAADAAPPPPSPRSLEGPGKEESAGEQAPPSLETWIPPVSGQEFGVANRFELTPGIGFSFNDPFLEKFIPQLSLGYHFGENWYLGLKGGFALSTSAGVVDACSTQADGTQSCGAPSSAQLQQLTGQMSGFVLLEGGWTPFYGKLNLFAEKVIHFDFSLLLGVGAVFAGTPASLDGSTPAGSAVAPALGPGIGEHLFISDHIAIAAELRDYLYLVGGGVQGQLMFNLGLSILLGAGPQG